MFDDKLDPEKSKIVEKFTDLEITFSYSEGKESEAMESETKDSENVQL